MKIKYRPHRGSLTESMDLQREFDSVENMLAFIVKDSRFHGKELYTKEDLVIGENLGKDYRIDWKETRYVMTKRCGDKDYDTPQCIGMCSFEEGEYNG